MGTRGLLIAGPSGSGKTALALALIEAVRASGFFARLIADDQVLLSMSDGRLIARAPEAIAGLVEVFGIGPKPIEHIGQAVVDGLCRLVPAASVPRLQVQTLETVHGKSLPRIDLAERNIQAALPAALAWMNGLGKA